MDGYKEFEFDLPSALLSNLVLAFSEIGSAPLNRNFIEQIPEQQGVYQLFCDDRLVYIGKTEAKKGLRNRLLRHHSKIQQRMNFSSESVQFKAVRVFVFTAMDLESQLIDHYGRPSWNGSGFGSNDPGQSRDKTDYKEDHFDVLFPIDIDFVYDNFPFSGNVSARDLIEWVKRNAEFTFRVQTVEKKKRKLHDDFDVTVDLQGANAVSIRSLLKLLSQCVPSGWQATKYPGYLTLYKEHQDVSNGEVVLRW